MNVDMVWHESNIPVCWVSLYPNIFTGVIVTVSDVVDPLVDQQAGVVRIMP